MSQRIYATTQEVAALFNRHPKTIQRWCQRGILDAIQPAGKGGQYLILIKALGDRIDSWEAAPYERPEG